MGATVGEDMFRSSGYMVECFWPDVTEEQLGSADRRAGRAADELTREHQDVRYLGSILVAEDEVVFFLFDAASAEVVEEAGRRAEIDFARIVRTIGVARSALPAPKEKSP